jgi:hypothetical protein
VIIELVDPRGVTWEVEQPVYRVYFWHQPPAPPDNGQDQIGYHCDEYRLSEAADVHEVIEWARNSARSDQTFVLHLEYRDSGGLGLIRLAGADPTDSP